MSVLLAAGAVAMLLVPGCASRGFVRQTIEPVQRETERLSQETVRLSRGLAEVQNSTSDAMARAELAVGSAAEARELALGKIGFRERSRGTVQFSFDSAELDGSARAALSALAKEIQASPELLVDIYGFTDETGSETYNFQLGQRRADAVLRYLADLTPGQLRRYAAVSYGETKPMTSEAGEAGRAQDRRVVISLIERVPLGSSDQETPPDQPQPGQPGPQAQGITTTQAGWQEP